MEFLYGAAGGAREFVIPNLPLDGLNYMKNHDIFTEIDQLISDLRAQNLNTLANILDHRLHRVAWTSGSELREELKKVLHNADCPDSVLMQRIWKIAKKL